MSLDSNPAVFKQASYQHTKSVNYQEGILNSESSVLAVKIKFHTAGQGLLQGNLHFARQ